MSLAISVDKVQAILLADGWHDVAGASFHLGAYEFFHDGIRLEEGESNGVYPTGFGFRELSGNHLYGPLAAILAVRVVRPSA